jgi:hypothetical protein
MPGKRGHSYATSNGKPGLITITLSRKAIASRRHLPLEPGRPSRRGGIFRKLDAGELVSVPHETWREIEELRELLQEGVRGCFIGALREVGGRLRPTEQADGVEAFPLRQTED